jgi:hypothetical protein
MRKRRMSGAKRVLAVLTAAVILLTCAGCAKENKYVNVGVEMSTAGMSLYLTNTVNGFQKISNYVFFPASPQESVDKIRQEKQGIDITYLPAKDLGLIKEGDGLTVVFPDCFDADGGLKGVWVAKNSWLEDAPNYSYRFILGLAMSSDYRASHMSMSYSYALDSVKGVRDVDWTKYPEVMQYCAVYSLSNKEELADEEFIVKSAGELALMFEEFALGTGEGYTICQEAYSRYCGSGTEAFEKLFDFRLARKALDDVLSSG